MISGAAQLPALAAPNAWSFLRCTTSDPALGSVGMELTHRTYDLAAAPL